MNIIYLYARLMPYQVVVFKELVKSYNANLIAISWDQEEAAPYVPEVSPGISYIPKSKFKNKKELLGYVIQQKPDLIYCSGWMDRDYIHVAKYMRNQIPVVAGSDTVWKGSIKQWLNVIASPLRHKRWFTHIWAAGTYQYEYARRLGFSKEKIILNSLTADTTLFSHFGRQNIKNQIRPHSFVYIGRFLPVKGTDLMIESFKEFKRLHPNDWKLICIGDGYLKKLLKGQDDVEVIEFLSQEDICRLSSEFGVFLLPSKSEQWGLAVHEAACLGLPLLVTKRAGANPTFLINGFNGYSFEPFNKREFIDAMLSFTNKNDQELLEMGNNSFLLSSRINPQITAASLMSVLNL